VSYRALSVIRVEITRIKDDDSSFEVQECVRRFWGKFVDGSLWLALSAALRLRGLSGG
jgi:hypothetical protein